ncbi:TIGR01456 family HAD hydrolase [Pichia kudriavzevii]|uniref:TIGR01456 family HAD hydrolase n=1 Tax=Pichia kudriavzevii TaxID=4909 RepID=A0A1Z8JN39_PICKU|nr:TIGR01456 family HAD hydrolase [Pichia kudriavzevii]
MTNSEIQRMSTPVEEVSQQLESKQDIGFVFDIDGVLLKGKKRIVEATEIITYLQNEKIPFILLTNGGGMTEKKRIDFINMTLQLETPIHPDQLIQAHTPMKTLIPHHKRVLICGGPKDDVREVAESYGFEDVIRPVDIIRANPTIWPYHMFTDEQIEQWGRDPNDTKLDVDGTGCKENLPIDSILCFNDSRALGAEIQIISDLLNSENGVLGTRRTVKSSKPSIPIVFSNNDFLWANEFVQPRFAMGVLKIATQTIYSKINGGEELEQLTLGKPEKVCYDYAHHILIDWRDVLLGKKKAGNVCLPQLNNEPLNSPFKKVYMVGDNPESDITGGNRYNWGTILVKTGVYQEGDFERNPEISKPSLGVFANVKEGVMHALKLNGLA